VDPRALAPIGCLVGVDDDPDEKADDLLALLDRQTGVETGPDLIEQVDGQLGRFLVSWGLHGRHTGFEFGSLPRHPVEFGVELGV
jgi:hypothetical protein